MLDPPREPLHWMFVVERPRRNDHEEGQCSAAEADKQRHLRILHEVADKERNSLVHLLVLFINDSSRAYKRKVTYSDDDQQGCRKQFGEPLTFKVLSKLLSVNSSLPTSSKTYNLPFDNVLRLLDICCHCRVGSIPRCSL